MRLYALELGPINIDHRVIMPAAPPDIRTVGPGPG